MAKPTIKLLKVVIVVLSAGAVLTQVAIPFMAHEVVRDFPEVHYLLVPYSLAAILAVGCIEVALVAVWRLLTMVDRDHIFTPHAFAWVDVVIVCAAIGAGVSALVGLHMLFAGIGNLVALLAMAGCTAIGLGASLLMAVMRRLLMAAIGYREESAEAVGCQAP